MANKPAFPKIMITHGGVFHADDVFAYAFLKSIAPINIMRVNTITDEMRNRDDAIIVDIGGGRYDHHFKSCMEFRNEEKKWNPYASFGKVVRDFWPYVFDDERMYHTFDNLLCIPIDMQDCNGSLLHGVSNELSLAISSFNLTWCEPSNPQAHLDAFLKAARFATAIVDRYIVKAKSIRKSAEIVEAAIAESTTLNHYCLVLPQYVNYNSYIAKSEKVINWVIYPSMRGGWQIYSITEHGVNRQLMSADLIKKLRAMDTTIFVHDSGFTATFKTLDAAIYASVLLYEEYTKDADAKESPDTQM